MIKKEAVIKAKVPLENLATMLSVSDLASILILKADRAATESQKDKLINVLTYELVEEIKTNRRGFSVRVAMPDYWDTTNQNMDGIMELLETGENGLKRKFLDIEYDAVEFLGKAGFIEIVGENWEYNTQILKPTQKLVDFMTPRLDENGRCNLDKTNEALRDAVIDILYPEDPKQKP